MHPNRNINHLIYKKSLIFIKKIAYIAEEVGECQISDSKSLILKNYLKIGFYYKVFLLNKQLFEIV